jgi:glycosyltransferase involved in cell wall biosynthesis
MVDVIVPCYNQGRYLESALRSILRQEAEFPIHIIIGDDCSTDNTEDICRDFLQKHGGTITYIRQSENIGLVKNYKTLFDACKSKYVAILEADDYWIDPHKIIKQTAILEANQRTGLVHTGSFTLFENGTIKRNHLSTPSEMLEGDIFHSLLTKKNTISPMTVMFRRSLLDDNIDFIFSSEFNFRTIDYPLWLSIAERSGISYMTEPTAVYRFLDKSASRPGKFKDREEFYYTSIRCKKYFIEKCGLPANLLQEALSPTYKILADIAVLYGDKKAASRYAGMVDKKGIKNRIMKAALQNKAGFYFYKGFLSILPPLSKVKQFFHHPLGGFHNYAEDIRVS